MNKRNRLAILHYLPLEKYPPVMNLLNMPEFSDQYRVLTMSSRSGTGLRPFVLPGGRIIRFPAVTSSQNRWLRLILYQYFYLGSLIRLLLFRPDVVLYYESYSALPVWWYLKFFNHTARLLIHFHEYFPPEWYRTGMKTVRLAHQKEQDFLFDRAALISQTNKFRVDLFLKDHPSVDGKKMCIVPNYPPRSWASFSRQIPSVGMPLRTVYIGSVSLYATYLEEYVRWIQRQNGSVLLDIITYAFDEPTRAFLEELDCPWVRFVPEGVSYEQIPEVLTHGRYDVGLIFYKGLHENTVYCASNKLFEYLACGLDVWCCKEMLGTYEFVTQGVFPRVLLVDYAATEEWNPELMISHEGLDYCPSMYDAETVYSAWINRFGAVSPHQISGS